MWSSLRSRRLLLFFTFLLAITTSLSASSESDIKSVLDTQVKAWNRGDIRTFVTTYAQDCVFVGKKVTQGRQQLLERYQRDYPTAAAMGRLTFSALAVHLVDNDVAFVTAQWHLERSAAGGGPVRGVFSLVLHRQNDGWKIALDHTS